MIPHLRGDYMSLPVFIVIDSTTCDIWRRELDPDHDMGSPAGEFVEIYTGVVCALDRSMSMSKVYGGGRERSIQGDSDMESFKIFVLPAQSILTGDKVIIGVTEYKVDDVVIFPTHKEGILTK
jgi:hypothetical protein